MGKVSRPRFLLTEFPSPQFVRLHKPASLRVLDREQPESFSKIVRGTALGNSTNADSATFLWSSCR